MELGDLYSGVVPTGSVSNSFSTILGNLSLGAGNRTNPGNRALYALQAFLAIVVAAATVSNPTTPAALTEGALDGGPFVAPTQAVESNTVTGDTAEVVSVSRFSSDHRPWTPPSTPPRAPSILIPHGHEQEEANDTNNRTDSDRNEASEFTSTDQVDLPLNLCTKFKKCYDSTRRLANWLVREAGRYQDVDHMYELEAFYITTYNGNRHRAKELTWTSTYVQLAQIIERNHGGRSVDNLIRVVAELEQNVRDRREVSAFYTRLRCEEGSAIDEDNRRKQAFNGRLAEVLVILRNL